jgi:hypothetical protein
MTVSVALVIVLLGANDSQLDRAFTQAAQIEGLQRRWSEVQARGYVSAAQAAQVPVGGTVNVSFPSITYKWDSAAKAFMTQGVAVGSSLQITPQQFTSYEDWKFPGTKMAETPGTIGEFRLWWNELNRGITVLVPNLAGGLKSCEVKVSGESQGALKCSPTASRPVIESKGFRWLLPKTPEQGISITWDFGPQSKWKVQEIRTSHELRTVKISEEFLASFYPKWGKGTFDVAFQELAAVSGNLQDLSVSNVREQVHEMQNRAEERFEAFGLKIPTAQVVRWGIALLLAGQLYFWIHLHELTRKIHPEDPGWEVAWIGVYSSKSAFIATLISSTVLPALAALMLGWRFWRSDTSASNWFWTTVLVGALLAAVVAALGAAFELFRLRRSM